MELKKYEWVIGRWKSESTPGKYALALAHSGIGYFTMEDDSTKDIILAFKRAVDYSKPFPKHIQLAAPHQIEALEKKNLERMGMKGRK